MRRERLQNPGFWLLAAAAALLAAAVAAPRATPGRSARDILAVVDITGSMNARDHALDSRPVSRLEFAKAALRRLTAALPCGSRLGLAVFSERRPFLLFEPAETCENFAAIDGAIAALDWRMAWEGDSYISAGLYRSIELAESVNADLLFISDGHDAPPPPATGGPVFEGRPGAVKGLIAGAGGRALAPIPKFDEKGREIGFYSPEDVPHESRVGLPPQDAQRREGWHERNAPFGGAATRGAEHLTSLREARLAALAAETGLAYTRLDRAESLAAALPRAFVPRRAEAGAPLDRLFAGLALVLLGAAYALPQLAARRRRPAATTAAKEKSQ